jgi:integrase
MTVRFEKQHNRYMINFVYRFPDGHRERIRVVAQTKNERKAEAEERAIRKSLDEGTYKSKEVKKAKKEIPTVAAFAKTFIDLYATPTNKPSEVTTKESVLRLYVIPAFGPKRLDRVGTMEVDRLKADLLKSGLKAKTVSNVLMIVSKMFGYAVDCGLIAVKPKIHFPKVTAPKFDFLTFEEAGALLAAAKEKAPEWFEPIFVTLRTGLRRGELFELRWGDTQLKGRSPRLLVSRSVSKGIVGTTKTGRAREVKLTPATVKVLERHKHLRSDLVFCGEDGSHVPQNTSDANLRRVCRLAGLREIGWHVLRHTYASHLVMKGVPLKFVQEQLGHATMQMTLRYAHLSPDSVSDAVAVLDEPEVRMWQQRGNDGELRQ